MHPIVSEMLVNARRADLERELSRRLQWGVPIAAAPEDGRAALLSARRWTAGRLRRLARWVDVTPCLDQEAHPVGR